MEAVTSVPNLLSRFQELKVPILAVYGEEDHVQELSRFSNLMPNLKVVMIRGAGRFVEWERPDDFNAILRRFLCNL